jgi:hypothetical protein
MASSEWERMDAAIEKPEKAIVVAESGVADPAVAADHVALAQAPAEVDRLYGPWAELEAKLKGRAHRPPSGPAVTARRVG